MCISGTIGDLRVEAGQRVTAGDLLASISRQESTLTVRGLFPGHRRSMLRQGQAVRLELDDYPRGADNLVIDRIEQDLRSSQAARPAIVVHAALRSATFTQGGQAVRYSEGMRGTMRVTLPSERLLTLLIPTLKPALEPTP